MSKGQKKETFVIRATVDEAELIKKARHLGEFKTLQDFCLTAVVEKAQKLKKLAQSRAA